MHELRGEVRSIADRLDSKLSFPPFDRDAGLFKLKGDIWTWMADLNKDNAPDEWRDIAQEAYRRAERYADNG